MPHAEQHRQFLHALIRDVAYELQLPAERAVLHELGRETNLPEWVRKAEDALAQTSAQGQPCDP